MMTTNNIPLEKYILIDKEKGKTLASFRDITSELTRRIIKNLYEGSKGGTQLASYRVDGLPSERKIFGGDLIFFLGVFNDFISGNPDEEGRIVYGSGKGKVETSFGFDGLVDYTTFIYNPRKSGDNE